MPYKIRKREDEYCVVKETEEGEETVDGGCHPTREEAKDHMQAIIINENEADHHMKDDDEEEEDEEDD